MMTNEMVNNNKITKVDRYKWIVQDQPGRLGFLNKHLLKVSPDYQRNAIETKVAAIRGAWSWIACGVIIVGERNGEYWVIDGQHRVKAAASRSDIQSLPCVIFKTAEMSEEARGFLNANTQRKPITSLDKFRASLAAEDEVALYVNSVLERLGIEPSGNASRPRTLKALSWAFNRAAEDREAFERVLTLNAQMCADHPVNERTLDGFWYLAKNTDVETFTKRIAPRAKSLGITKLLEAAIRASAYFARGGAKVWGEGMLGELNKGLRHKISLNGAE
jgi:hypothetical protein